MPEFIYLIHPLRHEFFENSTERENAVMDEHFEYLKRATSDGVVLLAGPCLDDTFGVVVLLFMSRSAVVGHESQGGPDLAGGRVVPSGRPGCVASLLTLQVCSPERVKHRHSECEAGLGAGLAGIRWRGDPTATGAPCGAIRRQLNGMALAVAVGPAGAARARSSPDRLRLPASPGRR
jgi:hypothetical protein